MGRASWCAAHRAVLVLVWVVLAAYAAAGASGPAVKRDALENSAPDVQATAAREPTRTPRAPPSSTMTLVPRADDDADAKGGITVTDPPQTADPSFYKIAAHESVTFGWQFTSLEETPSKLYVVASCSSNSNTYPIAPSPAGIDGKATNVTWYPYGYGKSAQANGQPALVAGKYRLVVYDDRGAGAAIKPGGVFNPNNEVEFSLYYPKAYTPLAGTYRSIPRRSPC